MATRKPTQSFPTHPSFNSVPPADTGAALRWARGGVKALALTVGGALTLVSLMALTGLIVQSGWIRSIVAVLVMLVIPAVIVDRLLPETADAKTKGLPTDVFALVWLGLALLFSVALHDVARPALITEGDRLNRAGYERLALLAYFVAGVQPTVEPPSRSETSPPKTPKHMAEPPKQRSAPVPELAAASASAVSSSTPVPELPPAKEKDAATLFEELAPAVVTVSVGDREHIRGGGTGFLVDSQGTIATNHHVIENAEQVKVSFLKGAVFKEPELLTEDAAVDLALLRVNLAKPDEGDPVEVTPLRLGDSDDIAVGERALSIGNPLGLDHTLTDGLISARRVYEGRQWIQTSVPISPGNSGGPLFNFKGEVIGVTTASVGSMFGLAQNLNLAVPVNILKRLLKDKYPARRKFGDGQRSAHW